MNTSASSYITFAPATKEAERIDIMAPLLNAMLEEFDSGKMKQGVEAFNNEIMERLDAAGLLQKEKIAQVERVGVHTD